MGALFLYVTCEFFLAIRGGPYMTLSCSILHHKAGYMGALFLYVTCEFFSCNTGRTIYDTHLCNLTLFVRNHMGNLFVASLNQSGTGSSVGLIGSVSMTPLSGETFHTACLIDWGLFHKSSRQRMVDSRTM